MITTLIKFAPIVLLISSTPLLAQEYRLINPETKEDKGTLEIISRERVKLNGESLVLKKIKETPKSFEIAKSIILPKFDVAAVSVKEAIDYLKSEGTRLGGGRVVNIVVIGDLTTKSPDGTEAPKRVTLQVTNMPLDEILRYLGEQTNFEVNYDDFAITLKAR